MAAVGIGDPNVTLTTGRRKGRLAASFFGISALVFPLKGHGRQAVHSRLRVTVGTIVGQIGAGRAIDELLQDYPYLAREDIAEALRYAAWRAEEREIELTDDR